MIAYLPTHFATSSFDVIGFSDHASLLVAWVWRPIFPAPWIFLLSVLAIAFALFAYIRVFRSNPVKRLFLLLLRLSVIAVITIILLGPSRLLESEISKQRGRLFVLADVSESMLTDDSDGQTRLDHLNRKWLSKNFIRELNENFSVELYEFAEKPRPFSNRLDSELEAIPDQDTHLVGSASALIDLIPSAGGRNAMLILSDGIDSEDASINRITRHALIKSIEVNTVAFGSNSNKQDAAVIAVPMQEYLYPNESGSILAKIYQVGCDNETTVLRVKQGDKIRRIPVSFGKQEVVEIKIPIQHDESGQYEYQLSLDKVTRESEVGNNEQTVFAFVQPRRMQVLLIEGQPFWDTKFIAQSLRKDERIELTQFSQIARSKRETIVTRSSDDQTSVVKLPATAEDWSRYDVIILGKQIENVLTPNSIRGLVEHVETTGGNLVLARGRPYDNQSQRGIQIGEELGPLEPIEWGTTKLPESKIRLTMSGKMTRWFMPTKMGLDVETALERLPGLASLDEVTRTKPSARILAEAAPDPDSEQRQPALVTASTGAGSVVAFTGEGAWKWSLLSTDNQDLSGFYDAFWSNMIRWLVIGGDFQPGQQLSMKLSRSSIRVGEEISVDIVLKQLATSGREPTLQVKNPDGTVQQIPLSPVAGRTPRLRARYQVEQNGVHEFLLDAAGMTPDSITRKFNAYSINVERLNTAARPMNMKMIADQTGGRFYGPNDCDEFIRQIQLDAEATKIPPKTVYIWDQAWLMIALIFVAGAEWIFRKTNGLI